MFIIPASDCIKCCFSNKSRNDFEDITNKTEVYFAETKNLGSRFSTLARLISDDELKRAARFYSDTERETYIFCHAFLRLILGERLGKNPLELFFIKETYNKPGLKNNPGFFNIAHTKDAFAIIFVKDFHVGIDLENIRQGIDINAIIKYYFGKEERDYILSSKEEAIDRFFLLWTRKEALLKAIGTGIINDLGQINVSGPLNFIQKKSFGNLSIASVSNEYYIYSVKLSEYFISMAVPQKSSISVYELNAENIPIYFNKYVDYR